MSYKIEKIQGIGQHFAVLLANANIHTTDDLMKHARSDDGLKRLAERSSIPLASLEVWAARADLMRVKGIGPQFSELLEASGVESVAELSMRNAENLLNLLTRVNEEKKLSRSVPTLHTLSQWVMRAQDMVPHDKAAVKPQVMKPQVMKPQVMPLDKQQRPAEPVIARQPMTGSGVGVGQRSDNFQVAGTGSGPYRVV